MAKEDLLLAPESLEALIVGLDDVATALGEGARGGLMGVRGHLEQAARARSDGRTDEAVSEILEAMKGLAQLAVTLGPAESQAMMALTSNFQSALRRGDAGHAADSVDSMRKNSGAVKKRGDEFKL